MINDNVHGVGIGRHKSILPLYPPQVETDLSQVLFGKDT